MRDTNPPIPQEARDRWSAARIRVVFYSPPVYYTPPILDALVAYCLHRAETEAEGRPNYCGPGWDRGGIWWQLRCLIREAGGCSICTEMQVEGDARPLRESVKKRFEQRHQHLIDFGAGRKRKINTSAAPYRNYDKPMPAHAVHSAWWEFVGDAAAVFALLQQHLVGVGKDVNAGYGWVRRWAMEPAASGTQDILSRRPVPVRIARDMGLPEGRIERRAWKAPYWSGKNVTDCVVGAA